MIGLAREDDAVPEKDSEVQNKKVIDMWVPFHWRGLLSVQVSKSDVHPSQLERRDGEELKCERFERTFKGDYRESVPSFRRALVDEYSLEISGEG